MGKLLVSEICFDVMRIAANSVLTNNINQILINCTDDGQDRLNNRLEALASLGQQAIATMVSASEPRRVA